MIGDFAILMATTTILTLRNVYLLRFALFGPGGNLHFMPVLPTKLKANVVSPLLYFLEHPPLLLVSTANFLVRLFEISRDKQRLKLCGQKSGQQWNDSTLLF